MANYEAIIEQKLPACDAQESWLDLKKLMDKGVISIAGVRNGCCYKYELIQD